MRDDSWANIERNKGEIFLKKGGVPIFRAFLASMLLIIKNLFASTAGDLVPFWYLKGLFSRLKFPVLHVAGDLGGFGCCGRLVGAHIPDYFHSTPLSIN